MPTNLFIITGNTGSGKSTFLGKLLDLFLKYGISFSGFISTSRKIDSGGERTYDLTILPHNERFHWATEKRKKEWIEIEHFYFNPDALIRGHEVLVKAETENRLLVIDEVGPFELRGKLWAKEIRKLLNNKDLPMIWVVRKSLVAQIVRNWKIRNYVTFDVEKTHPEHAAKVIMDNLGK